jgi:uncharacterized repeat protein (TIGR01451 family)
MFIFNNSFKNNLNHMFGNNKKAALTIFAAGMLATVVVASTVAADGPTFNIFPIGYSGSLNTDYPLLDARNATKGEGWSTSQTDHDAGVTADPGDTIEFLVYYHNGAPDSPTNTAKNVTLRVTVPTNSAKTFTIGALLSASNAQTISSGMKGGDIVVNITGSENQTLSLVPGSTVWLPNRGASSQIMPDTITGNGISLGDIRGCWEFSGYVKFKVKVSNNQPSYSFNLTKQVRKAGVGSYGASVTANPGETVEFKITGTNTGTGPISHFIFTDTLPAKLTFVPGTLQVSQTPLSGNLFSSGLDVGQVNPGASVVLTFQAQLDSEGSFPIGTTTLTNAVTLSSQGPVISPQSASAQVVVNVSAPQTCTIRVQATLDGQPWSGNLSYSINGPTPTSGTSVPQNFTNRALGMYVANAPTGGPASSTFNGVTPTSGNCTGGNVLTFTYQYSFNQIKDFSITKQVRNITTGGAFDSAVNAQPSQTVEFKIEVTNLGNTKLTDFLFRDELPNKMSYVPGTLTMNGTAMNSPNAVFSQTGVFLDDLLAGEKRTFIFQALLAAQDQFPVGQTTLTNTAYASFSKLAQKSASASVVVNKSAPVKENGSPANRPQ